MNSIEVSRPRFKFYLFHLLVLGSWTSFSTSLSFGLLPWKMGMIKISIPQVRGRKMCGKLLSAAADKFSINTCWLWLSAEVSECSQGAWGASGSNLKAEANPQESLHQLKFQSCATLSWKSAPKVYLQSPRELKQYNLILVFIQLGAYLFASKIHPSCVCVPVRAWAVLLCTEAAWSQATGGPCQGSNKHPTA